MGRSELPAAATARVRAVAAGTLPPVAARDAVTVVLLRPASNGPVRRTGVEVYLLRRKRSMAFAPGAWVFPGGSVDPADDTGDPVARAARGLDGSVPGHRDQLAVPTAGDGPAGDGAAAANTGGPPAVAFAAAWNVTPRRAAAFALAAIRETFEESGVLLAGPSPSALVGDTAGRDWAADRRALLAGSVSLPELLRRRGLVPRADLLRPWARWITPEGQPRRYDTRFFVAALPAGARTAPDCDEADETMWLSPATALAGAEAGRIALMLPTVVTLREIAGFPDVPAVLFAARRRSASREPRLVVAGDDVLPPAAGEARRDR